MTKPTVAESAWLEFVIAEHLRPALKAAEQVAADLGRLRTCDAAGCGRMFDGGDPRSSTITDKGYEYHYCPACEMEAQARAVTK